MINGGDGDRFWMGVRRWRWFDFTRSTPCSLDRDIEEVKRRSAPEDKWDDNKSARGAEERAHEETLTGPCADCCTLLELACAAEKKEKH